MLAPPARRPTLTSMPAYPIHPQGQRYRTLLLARFQHQVVRELRSQLRASAINHTQILSVLVVGHPITARLQAAQLHLAFPRLVWVRLEEGVIHFAILFDGIPLRHVV